MKKYTGSEINYEKYLDPKPVLAGVTVAIAALLFAGGMILSENIIISLVFSCTGTVLIMRELIKERRKKTIKTLEKQFAEVMQSVLSATCAGIPIDRAFIEIEAGDNAGLSLNRLMMKEIHTICYGMRLNFPFDRMLEKFAERSGSAEIRNFSNVLSITSAKGGNISFAIRSSLANMRVKIDTDQEIDKTLALPVYNQRIMMVMPFALVLLIKSISNEYMQVMYQSPIGKIITLCCSVLLIIAWIVGTRICRIEV